MADNLESLGRLVHETRLAHEAGVAARDGRSKFNLPPWEERSGDQRELDMRFAAAVTARVLADADAEAADLRAEVLRYRVHRDVILHALRIAEAAQEYQSVARHFRAARAALDAGRDEP